MGEQLPRAGEREEWPPVLAESQFNSVQLGQQSVKVKTLAAMERIEQIRNLLKITGARFSLFKKRTIIKMGKPGVNLEAGLEFEVSM